MTSPTGTTTVGLQGWYPWTAVAEGFRKLARIGAQFVNAENQDRDYLVHPIVFNYRHYLEVKLKELILEGSLLLDRRFPNEILRTHDLRTLWRSCRTILESVGLEGTAGEEELDAIGEAVEELATIDGGSYAFRYPVDIKGNPSLPGGLSYINLRHFSDQMEKIAGCLDACDVAISTMMDGREAREYQEDLAAEYRKEMSDY